MHRCPESTTNPNTGKPFDLNLIRKVMATECYDVCPENPWRFQSALQRTFLPPEVKEHRVSTCRWFHQFAGMYTEAWFYTNVVWMDPCSSILPGSKKQFPEAEAAVEGWQAVRLRRRV